MIGVLVGFPLRVSFVHAEDGERNQGQEIKNSIHEEEDDVDDEDMDDDEDGQTNGEHDIFSLLLEDSQNLPVVNLGEVDEATIVTYADVVSVLKNYQNAVSQISADAGVDTDTANLSVKEKALLDGLVNKHHNQFDRLNNRIAEVSAQLKQLEDLLSPLGTESITSLYGIKDLLISELNNYRDIINGISEFDNLNLETLQRETD